MRLLAHVLGLRVHRNSKGYALFRADEVVTKRRIREAVRISHDEMKELLVTEAKQRLGELGGMS